MWPICIVPDRPLRPLIASDGMPHSGASRGNRTNSTAMKGAPSKAIQLAVFRAVVSGGRPTTRCALTNAVSSPSKATSIAPAVSSDWEKKKFVSIVKKPRKKITKASRRARSSSVFSESSTTIRVTPASRPSRVRWVQSVAPRVIASRARRQARPGRGRAVTASQPRQSSTAAASAVHQAGRCETWGMTIQAITASRNRVSRASRGRALRRFNTARAPRGRPAGARRRWRACTPIRAGAGRNRCRGGRPPAPRRTGG